jgi:NDP-sugar pyrophosphorylase family protein
MKIIIPMSGVGKRFVEAGYTVPKALLEIRGKPIIEHVFDLFPGETDIHCICNSHHLATTNMREVLTARGATIHEIAPHSLGPVYAVSQMFDKIGDDEEVIVSYCDYGTDWDYAAFRRMCGGYDGVIAAYTGFHPHMLFGDNYAFLRMEEDGLRVAEVREKESFTGDKMTEYASNGTYYFRRGGDMKHYFQELMRKGIKKNGEFYVSLVYNELIGDGKRVGVFEIDRMLQWGTPRDVEVYKMWESHFAHVPKPCISQATLVLPMAGRGSRFSMVGYTDPKPLLPVKGVHMIVQAVANLPVCERKIFITLQEHMEAYDLASALHSTYPECKIMTIPTVTEGQACTSAIAVEGLAPTEPVLISACDNGVDFDAGAYMALENDPTVDVIVWSFDNNPTSKLYPHMYAWLDVDAENNVRHVSVKRYFDGARQAIIGTMFFRTAALYREGYQIIRDRNIRTNGEFYVDDLLNPLIEKGYRVKSFPVKNYICWGTPNDYRTYQYWCGHFAE